MTPASPPPQVSVVMIFYNPGPFFDEAIESVLQQTFHDWELLLVDDGSTDGSSEVARRHAGARPSQVRCLAHPGGANRGMSASRNLGIEHARGEYIALIDSDDTWLPEKLEKQLALLRAEPRAAMHFGPALLWSSWQGAGAAREPDGVTVSPFANPTLIEPPELVARFLAEERYSPCIGTILVRRQACIAVGGFEESFRGMYEDQVFCSKIGLEYPILYGGGVWFHYRQHDSQCMRKWNETHVNARDRFFRWLRAHLDQRRLSVVSVRREIARYHRQRWGLWARAKGVIRVFVPAPVRAWIRSVRGRAAT